MTHQKCDLFGVEIVGKIAYTEKINRSDTAYGKQRNDFEGTKEECLKYIGTKDIKEVIGVLNEL